jgi:hypothetical protein
MRPLDAPRGANDSAPQLMARNLLMRRCGIQCPIHTHRVFDECCCDEWAFAQRSMVCL